METNETCAEASESMMDFIQDNLMTPGPNVSRVQEVKIPVSSIKAYFGDVSAITSDCCPADLPNRWRFQ